MKEVLGFGIQLGSRVRPATYEQLKAKAQAEGSNVCAITRRAIERYLEEEDQAA